MIGFKSDSPLIIRDFHIYCTNVPTFLRPENKLRDLNSEKYFFSFNLALPMMGRQILVIGLLLFFRVHMQEVWLAERGTSAGVPVINVEQGEGGSSHGQVK